MLEQKQWIFWTEREGQPVAAQREGDGDTEQKQTEIDEEDRWNDLEVGLFFYFSWAHVYVPHIVKNEIDYSPLMWDLPL